MWCKLSDGLPQYVRQKLVQNDAQCQQSVSTHMQHMCTLFPHMYVRTEHIYIEAHSHLNTYYKSYKS